MRVKFEYGFFFVCLFFLCIKIIWAQRPADDFIRRSFSNNGTTLPYRLFIPKSYDNTIKYPLVVSLHGAGERGTDNNSPIMLHRLAEVWAEDTNQTRQPVIVVSPQCPNGNQWVDLPWSNGAYNSDQVPISNEIQTVNDLLDSLIREFSIDTNRIYATGLSMGGYGTFDILVRYPNRFAAILPQSGAGDPFNVSTYKEVAIWGFHGEADGVVPASGTKDVMSALEVEGLDVVYTHCHSGNCTGMSEQEIADTISAGAKYLYTGYENDGHNVWAKSYDWGHVVPWTYSQKRGCMDSNFLEFDSIVTVSDGRQCLTEKPEGVRKVDLYRGYYVSNSIITLTESKTYRIRIYSISGEKISELNLAGPERIPVNYDFSSGRFRLIIE